MNRTRTFFFSTLFSLSLALTAQASSDQNCDIGLRGTGDMGVIVERVEGNLLIIENSTNSSLCRVSGLGDLSHASVVFSRDQRFAYVFGRDGGLTKVDILLGKIDKRVVQGGNSIGGAISQDGSLIAVSNYKPGGIKIFDSNSLELIADIKAEQRGSDQLSKTVGLVDAPNHKFIFSLFEGAATWVVDMSNPQSPSIDKYENIGNQPYDALMSADGRYYIAGLFGEDGLALLDLWQIEKGVTRILPNYGKGKKKLPVYKMPHLEGWAMAGDLAFLPAIGLHQVLVANKNDWSERARIDVKGQPVFAMARPDGRQVWVNFAVPDNQWIQVIDVKTLQVIKTLEVGKGALHMEFSPRGEEVWISVRDQNQVKIYDTRTLELKNSLDVRKPSGIFFTHRSGQIGL